MVSEEKMFENVDGRQMTDYVRVIGILFAHPLAFGAVELTREYNQEMTQAHTNDQPRERDIEHLQPPNRDNTIKVKQPALSSSAILLSLV